MLLIEANEERRSRLSRALTEAGVQVRAVAGIAEVERWPAGDVVVTESRRFTPLWKETGAVHVVVLADTSADGDDACRRGASAWIPRHAAAETLIDVLYGLGAASPPYAAGDQHVQ